MAFDLPDFNEEEEQAPVAVAIPQTGDADRGFTASGGIPDFNEPTAPSMPESPAVPQTVASTQSQPPAIGGIPDFNKPESPIPNVGAAAMSDSAQVPPGESGGDDNPFRGYSPIDEVRKSFESIGRGVSRMARGDIAGGAFEAGVMGVGGAIGRGLGVPQELVRRGVGTATDLAGLATEGKEGVSPLSFFSPDQRNAQIQELIRPDATWQERAEAAFQLYANNVGVLTGAPLLGSVGPTAVRAAANVGKTALEGGLSAVQRQVGEAIDKSRYYRPESAAGMPAGAGRNVTGFAYDILSDPVNLLGLGLPGFGAAAAARARDAGRAVPAVTRAWEVGDIALNAPFNAIANRFGMPVASGAGLGLIAGGVAGATNREFMDRPLAPILAVTPVETHDAIRFFAPIFAGAALGGALRIPIGSTVAWTKTGELDRTGRSLAAPTSATTLSRGISGAEELTQTLVNAARLVDDNPAAFIPLTVRGMREVITSADRSPAGLSAAAARGGMDIPPEVFASTENRIGLNAFTSAVERYAKISDPEEVKTFLDRVIRDMGEENAFQKWNQLVADDLTARVGRTQPSWKSPVTKYFATVNHLDAIPEARAAIVAVLEQNKRANKTAIAMLNDTDTIERFRSMVSGDRVRSLGLTDPVYDQISREMKKIEGAANKVKWGVDGAPDRPMPLDKKWAKANDNIVVRMANDSKTLISPFWLTYRPQYHFNNAVTNSIVGLVTTRGEALSYLRADSRVRAMELRGIPDLPAWVGQRRDLSNEFVDPSVLAPTQPEKQFLAPGGPKRPLVEGAKGAVDKTFGVFDLSRHWDFFKEDFARDVVYTSQFVRRFDTNFLAEMTRFAKVSAEAAGTPITDRQAAIWARNQLNIVTTDGVQAWQRGMEADHWTKHVDFSGVDPFVAPQLQKFLSQFPTPEAALAHYREFGDDWRKNVGKYEMGHPDQLPIGLPAPREGWEFQGGPEGMGKQYPPDRGGPSVQPEAGPPPTTPPRGPEPAPTPVRPTPETQPTPATVRGENRPLRNLSDEELRQQGMALYRDLKNAVDNRNKPRELAIRRQIKENDDEGARRWNEGPTGPTPKGPEPTPPSGPTGPWGRPYRPTDAPSSPRPNSPWLREWQLPPDVVVKTAEAGFDPKVAREAVFDAARERTNTMLDEWSKLSVILNDLQGVGHAPRVSGKGSTYDAAVKREIRMAMVGQIRTALGLDYANVLKDFEGSPGSLAGAFNNAVNRGKLDEARKITDIALTYKNLLDQYGIAPLPWPLNSKGNPDRKGLRPIAVVPKDAITDLTHLLKTEGDRPYVTAVRGIEVKPKGQEATPPVSAIPDAPARRAPVVEDDGTVVSQTVAHSPGKVMEETGVADAPPNPNASTKAGAELLSEQDRPNVVNSEAQAFRDWLNTPKEGGRAGTELWGSEGLNRAAGQETQAVVARGDAINELYTPGTGVAKGVRKAQVAGASKIVDALHKKSDDIRDKFKFNIEEARARELMRGFPDPINPSVQYRDVDGMPYVGPVFYQPETGKLLAGVGGRPITKGFEWALDAPTREFVHNIQAEERRMAARTAIGSAQQAIRDLPNVGDLRFTSTPQQRRAMMVGISDKARSGALSDTRSALFGYDDKTIGDYLMSAIAPYPYWAIRHMAQQGRVVATHPGMYAAYMSVIHNWYQDTKDQPPANKWSVYITTMPDGTQIRFRPQALLPYATGQAFSVLSKGEAGKYRDLDWFEQLEQWTGLGAALHWPLEMARQKYATETGAKGGLFPTADREDRAKNLISHTKLVYELSGGKWDAEAPLRQLIYGTTEIGANTNAAVIELADRVNRGEITPQQASQAILSYRDGNPDANWQQAFEKGMQRTGLTNSLPRFLGAPITSISPERQRLDQLQRQYGTMRDLGASGKEIGGFLRQNPDLPIKWSGNDDPRLLRLGIATDAYFRDSELLTSKYNQQLKDLSDAFEAKKITPNQWYQSRSDIGVNKRAEQDALRAKYPDADVDGSKRKALIATISAEKGPKGGTAGPSVETPARAAQVAAEAKAKALVGNYYDLQDQFARPDGSFDSKGYAAAKAAYLNSLSPEDRAFVLAETKKNQTPADVLFENTSRYLPSVTPERAAYLDKVKEVYEAARYAKGGTPAAGRAALQKAGLPSNAYEAPGGYLQSRNPAYQAYFSKEGAPASGTTTSRTGFTGVGGTGAAASSADRNKVNALWDEYRERQSKDRTDATMFLARNWDAMYSLTAKDKIPTNRPDPKRLELATERAALLNKLPADARGRALFYEANATRLNALNEALGIATRYRTSSSPSPAPATAARSPFPTGGGGGSGVARPQSPIGGFPARPVVNPGPEPYPPPKGKRWSWSRDSKTGKVTWFLIDEHAAA